MSDWTRSAVSGLGEMAMQLGLTVPGSYEALQIGARLRAHGFNTREIHYAIQKVYEYRASLDLAHQLGILSPREYEWIKSGGTSK